MKTMGDRLRYARELKFRSAAKAAEALGVAASTYRAHENGQNEFSPEEAEKYGRKFGVGAAYLLTGEDAPWRQPNPRASPIIASYDPDDEQSRTYWRESWQSAIPGAIPELHGKIGAGQGSSGDMLALPIGRDGVITGHKVVAEWLLSETFLRNEAKASPRSSIIMEVVGDSMQPTYLPGDRVIVDLAQTTLSVDTVYVISDGYSEPQIKRLQRVPFSSPTQVRIISDNSIFPTDVVDLDMLTIIGRVCGHIARK